ncbi:hypothetical protein LEG80045_22900 [Legionella pneumophila]|nr:hypothetical protein LEG80045_22900 [Legionella pneumophila]
MILIGVITKAAYDIASAKAYIHVGIAQEKGFISAVISWVKALCQYTVVCGSV